MTNIKIYQLHESGGSYEDYYNIILASYLHKSKAQEHLNKLNKDKRIIEEEVNKCCNCPINHLTKRKYNKNKDIINNYCDKADIQFDDNYVDCGNILEYPYLWDEPYYQIKEVDVIE